MNEKMANSKKMDINGKIMIKIMTILILCALVGCSGKGTPDDGGDATGVPSPVPTSEVGVATDIPQPTPTDAPRLTPTPTPIPDELMPFNDITATELVADIRAGWNMGNVLSAFDGSTKDYGSYSVNRLETLWVNTAMEKDDFDAYKEAGFNAVRIPVTWFKAMDDEYGIRVDYMNRVKEIVNYAIDNDMYVVLNTHGDERLFGLMDKDVEESKENVTKVWGQIADAFKNYDERLIFEPFNEPRTVGSAKEWNGGTTEERKNLNTLNQVFVDTVRASGGNNDKRILMVSIYSAHAYADVLKDVVMPTDKPDDRLILTIHEYVPYNFALNADEKSGTATWDKESPADTKPIMEPLDRAYDMFVSKGVPVVMGEFGALNKDNLDARVEWVEFYVSYAKSKGIPCFWWDNFSMGVTARYSWGVDECFGLLDRATNTFKYPEIVSAIMRGIE